MVTDRAVMNHVKRQLFFATTVGIGELQVPLQRAAATARRAPQGRARGVPFR